MAKRKIDPVRRGLGSQSDFVTEPFVPDALYKEQQITMAQKLIAAGLNPEQVAGMFFIPIDLLQDEEPGAPGSRS